MKKAVVVMQDHESELFKRRAIAFIYEGEAQSNIQIGIPEDLVVEHVDIPVELENESAILADIDENDVVSLRLPNPGEVEGA